LAVNSDAPSAFTKFQKPLPRNSESEKGVIVNPIPEDVSMKSAFSSPHI